MSNDETELEAQDEFAFSRSTGVFAQSGNADCEVKTRLSFEEADELRLLARSCGMNTSEFLRILIKVRLKGVDAVERMTADHLRRVAGSGTETGHQP